MKNLQKLILILFITISCKKQEPLNKIENYIQQAQSYCSNKGGILKLIFSLNTYHLICQDKTEIKGKGNINA